MHTQGLRQKLLSSNRLHGSGNDYSEEEGDRRIGPARLARGAGLHALLAVGVGVFAGRASPAQGELRAESGPLHFVPRAGGKSILLPQARYTLGDLFARSEEHTS